MKKIASFCATVALTALLMPLHGSPQSSKSAGDQSNDSTARLSLRGVKLGSPCDEAARFIESLAKAEGGLAEPEPEGSFVRPACSMSGNRMVPPRYSKVVPRELWDEVSTKLDPASRTVVEVRSVTRWSSIPRQPLPTTQDIVADLTAKFGEPSVRGRWKGMLGTLGQVDSEVHAYIFGQPELVGTADLTDSRSVDTLLGRASGVVQVAYIEIARFAHGGSEVRVDVRIFRVSAVAPRVRL